MGTTIRLEIKMQDHANRKRTVIKEDVPLAKAKQRAAALVAEAAVSFGVTLGTDKD